MHVHGLQKFTIYFGDWVDFHPSKSIDQLSGSTLLCCNYRRCGRSQFSCPVRIIIITSPLSNEAQTIWPNCKLLIDSMSHRMTPASCRHGIWTYAAVFPDLSKQLSSILSWPTETSAQAPKIAKENKLELHLEISTWQILCWQWVVWKSQHLTKMSFSLCFWLQLKYNGSFVHQCGRLIHLKCFSLHGRYQSGSLQWCNQLD